MRILASILAASVLAVCSTAPLIPPTARELDNLIVFNRHDKRSLWAERPQQPFQLQDDEEAQKKPKRKVSVSLGVMSKCPDAAICEAVFDKVIPQVEGLIDLSMIYIGKFNESRTPYGVECKHGGQECDGNVQQLCVQKHAGSTKDWWNFIQCQNFEKSGRVGDISLARQCSKLISHDWDSDFSNCYTGKEGRHLLQASVKQAHVLNVTKSCSVLVEDKIICVHDGSWRDCTSGHEPVDFVKYIEGSWKELNGE